MISTKILNAIEWVLVASCVTVVVVGIAFYARYQEHIADLRLQIAESQRTLSELRLRAAKQVSSGNVAAMTLRDIVSSTENLGTICKDADILRKEISQTDRARGSSDHSSASVLTFITTLCGVQPTYEDPSMEFKKPYGEAMSYRIAGAYRESAKAYSSAIDSLKKTKGQSEWLMRAYEGRAYSYLQLGDRTEAESDLNSSLAQQSSEDPQLGYHYVFARMTRMKLWCSQRKPTNSITTEFNRVTKDLQTMIDDGSEVDHLYYGYDLGYLKRDQELYLVCAYAGIKPDMIPDR